jgi:hypothetical protein
MSMKKNQTPQSKAASRGEQNSDALSRPPLCVTVIATTDEGTTAALNAASCLATDLGARITLLKMEIALNRFPLSRPHGSLLCTINRQDALVRRPRAREGNVDIQIRLCRDFDSGLQRVLRRRALVVLGGRRHWWLSGEEKLERSLRRLGHHVIFVDVAQEAHWTAQHISLPDSLGGGAGRFRQQEFNEKPVWGNKDWQ